MACTTILVGKKASFDGSTLVARNEDSPSVSFVQKNSLLFIKRTTKIYKSVISKVEIPLPEILCVMLVCQTAVDNEGIWGSLWAKRS